MNDAEEKFQLAGCYARGDGPERSWERAVRWLRRAAEAGHAGAEYELGLCFSTGEGVAKDLKRAALLYQRAADKGHPEAQYDLGICFVTGQGMRKDEAKGLELIKRAAEQGQAGAWRCPRRSNIARPLSSRHSTNHVSTRAVRVRDGRLTGETRWGGRRTA